MASSEADIDSSEARSTVRRWFAMPDLELYPDIPKFISNYRHQEDEDTKAQKVKSWVSEGHWWKDIERLLPSRSAILGKSQADLHRNSSQLWDGTAHQTSTPVTSEGSNKQKGKDSSSTERKGRMLLIQPDFVGAARENILYLLDRTIGGERQPSKVVLNIAALQRTILHDLQQRIAIYVSMLKNHGEVYVQSEDAYVLVDLIHKYTTAVRDLEYMQERAKKGFDTDPFLVMSSRALESRSLKRAGLIPKEVEPLLPNAHDEQYPVIFPPAPYRHSANQVAARKDSIARFVLAAFGGLALIVPMIIMVRVPGETASLIITSVFTVGFAAAIAWGSDQDASQILAGTAAYAAVLVVFVGATLNPHLNS